MLTHVEIVPLDGVLDALHLVEEGPGQGDKEGHTKRLAEGAAERAEAADAVGLAREHGHTHEIGHRWRAVGVFHLFDASLGTRKEREAGRRFSWGRKGEGRADVPQIDVIACVDVAHRLIVVDPAVHVM